MAQDYLLQVTINHPNGNTGLILVEGAENERQARRTAYEAVFGEPMDDEEQASDETVEEYTRLGTWTTVRNIKRIKIGGDA
jgi:hypothetical protein